ncbi:MAG: hypothetical protein Q8K55_09420 [Gemmatimonadaceae bacterium]|nr:hypothetical protein [Gemmatimonadaceae bacterium]
MRQLTVPRFVLTILACLAALSGPASAVAHGMAHHHGAADSSTLGGSLGAGPTSVHRTIAALDVDADEDHAVLHQVAVAPQRDRAPITAQLIAELGESSASPVASCQIAPYLTTPVRCPETFFSTVQIASQHVPAATRSRAPPLG